MNEIIMARKTQITPEHENEHQSFEYFKYTVVGASTGNQCNVGFYEIPPGKANYPYHYHTANEEIFYIISGTGLLKTPDGEKTVSSGDVIIFPPSEKGAHKLTNISKTETLTYLDVDTNRFPEVVFYPDSEKVGIKEKPGMHRFYMQDAEVDYYVGE